MKLSSITLVLVPAQIACFYIPLRNITDVFLAGKPSITNDHQDEPWNPYSPDGVYYHRIDSKEYFGGFTRQLIYPNTTNFELKAITDNTNSTDLFKGQQVREERRQLDKDPHVFEERHQLKSDPIENDPQLHCYHFPARNGHPQRYRRCYEKGWGCNIKWRFEVLAFRKECIEPKEPALGVCPLIYEPDIEAQNYCGDSYVHENDQGGREWPCEVQGMGEGAVCPGSTGTTDCSSEYEGKCQKIEPELENRACIWYFEFHCFGEDTKVCAGDPYPYCTTPNDGTIP